MSMSPGREKGGLCLCCPEMSGEGGITVLYCPGMSPETDIPKMALGAFAQRTQTAGT